MGRPRKPGVQRRVQLRIAPQWVGVFDSYNSDQLSEIFGKALSSYLPGSDRGQRITTVVRPENPISTTIARISCKESTVRVLFPERLEEFRDVVKLKSRFEWSNPFWIKEVRDVGYEVSLVAYNLLSSGFCVQSDSLGIADKVISGEFQLTGLRKIDLFGIEPFSDWLEITWPRSGCNYYDEAIVITAAKYKRGVVIVPPEHHEEVEDFAEQYDFSFSPTAQSVVASMRRSQSVGFVPSPKRKQRQLPEATGDIPEGLIDGD